jgi:nicotinate phosphoribosyltransferase
MAFDDEADALRSYAREFPDGALLLVDTYDAEQGMRRAAAIGRELAEQGHTLRGVRLDSGDVIALARLARRILDEAGLTPAQILVSGDLNEWRIAEIVTAGAPVDAFGVGTELGVIADAPALGGVYKLAEYAGRGRAKRSVAKETMPGRKQVWRLDDFTDVIELADAHIEAARPLLELVMRDGRPTWSGTLADARARCATSIAALPEDLRDLAPQHPGAPARVRVGSSLR